MPASPSRMIAVGMGDYGPVHAPPGIDIKIACRAVKSVFGELDE
jgi:hypothetical protein